ncbi:hypothetical protein SCD_n02892 [Sulfuricella denitrificans skB26]|uniref:Uncharacterized protein n=1 Tax=Sulfuricella denitrificans (strain DSM 22764 / NBRC 105220 / skB26) TaxID=1163617 RepID=S6AJZ5_SULDS|nr:hypothetical protein SCD_n02892 [Sulfuricella denitrificans skB26]
MKKPKCNNHRPFPHTPASHTDWDHRNKHNQRNQKKTFSDSNRNMHYPCEGIDKNGNQAMYRQGQPNDLEEFPFTFK